MHSGVVLQLLLSTTAGTITSSTTAPVVATAIAAAGALILTFVLRVVGAQTKQLTTKPVQWGEEVVYVCVLGGGAYFKFILCIQLFVDRLREKRDRVVGTALQEIWNCEAKNVLPVHQHHSHGIIMPWQQGRYSTGPLAISI